MHQRIVFDGFISTGYVVVAEVADECVFLVVGANKSFVLSHAEVLPHRSIYGTKVPRGYANSLRVSRGHAQRVVSRRGHRRRVSNPRPRSPIDGTPATLLAFPKHA